MEVEFTKMHGALNDFVMIDDREERCRFSGETIARLCSRRRGIGADGLILLRSSAAADFAMRYFNSDGGEADMCGNGARCVAALAFRAGIAGSSMTFETRAGVVSARILEDGVRIGIGDVRSLRLGMKIGAAAADVHYAVCGVPHAVIIRDDVRNIPREEFIRSAAEVRNDPSFGVAGANVDVVSVIDRGRCRYRTYERGVEDETLACGTGAVVIAAVLTHLGLADPPVRCETSGGHVLEVDLAKAPGGASACHLTGPVAVSFRGTFRIEEYDHA